MGHNKTQTNANDSSLRYSESGIADQTNLGDISGCLSQDMQRIAHLKAQEQENIELKEQIQHLDNRFKEIVTTFNAKISNKNKKIRDLTKQIKDLQNSFQILTKNVKEASEGGRNQVLINHNKKLSQEASSIKIVRTQDEQSNDGSVLYKT